MKCEKRTGLNEIIHWGILHEKVDWLEAVGWCIDVDAEERLGVRATDCAAAAARRSWGAAPKRKRAQSGLIKELIKNGLFGEWRHGGGAGRPRPRRRRARSHAHFLPHRARTCAHTVRSSAHFLPPRPRPTPNHTLVSFDWVHPHPPQTT